MPLTFCDVRSFHDFACPFPSLTTLTSFFALAANPFQISAKDIPTSTHLPRAHRFLIKITWFPSNHSKQSLKVPQNAEHLILNVRVYKVLYFFCLCDPLCFANTEYGMSETYALTSKQITIWFRCPLIP